LWGRGRWSFQRGDAGRALGAGRRWWRGFSWRARREAPLSVLSYISPARGEIASVTDFPLLIAGASKCESGETADLPPRGGDVRQDREGRLAPEFHKKHPDSPNLHIQPDIQRRGGHGDFGGGDVINAGLGHRLDRVKGNAAGRFENDPAARNSYSLLKQLRQHVV
jgi:hypothetical protein